MFSGVGEPSRCWSTCIIICFEGTNIYRFRSFYQHFLMALNPWRFRSGSIWDEIPPSLHYSTLARVSSIEVGPRAMRLVRDVAVF